MVLKKITAIVFTAVAALALAVGVSAVGHTSADQVFGADGRTDLASVVAAAVVSAISLAFTAITRKIRL